MNTTMEHDYTSTYREYIEILPGYSLGQHFVHLPKRITSVVMRPRAYR
jgi:hypothetical protein